MKLRDKCERDVAADACHDCRAGRTPSRGTQCWFIRRALDNYRRRLARRAKKGA